MTWSYNDGSVTEYFKNSLLKLDTNPHTYADQPM